MIIIAFIAVLGFSWFFGAVFTDEDNFFMQIIKGLGIFFLIGVVLKVGALILGLGMTAHGL